MTLEEIQNIISNYKKGSYIKLKWGKNITLKNKEQVRKETKLTARLGIDYASLESVKSKEVDPNKEIKPVEWLIHNYVKKSTTGKSLLMVYTTNMHKPDTVWYDMDGNVIDVNSIKDNLYAKDQPKHVENLELMTIDIANLEIMGEATNA